MPNLDWILPFVDEHARIVTLVLLGIIASIGVGGGLYVSALKSRIEVVAEYEMIMDATTTLASQRVDLAEGRAEVAEGEAGALRAESAALDSIRNRLVQVESELGEVRARIFSLRDIAIRRRDEMPGELYASLMELTSGSSSAVPYWGTVLFGGDSDSDFGFVPAGHSSTANVILYGGDAGVAYSALLGNTVTSSRPVSSLRGLGIGDGVAVTLLALGLAIFGVLLGAHTYRLAIRPVEPEAGTDGE